MVLVIPGLVHLSYLYWDMVHALIAKGLSLEGMLQPLLIESLKDTPRVGRRYVSLAMVQLIFTAGIINFYTKRRALKRCAFGLLLISLFSLALLDARSAYVSIFIASAAMLSVFGYGILPICFQSGFSVKKNVKLLCVAVCSVLIISTVAFNAGKSRWLAMEYSVGMAFNDVFKSTAVLSDQPFVSIAFWEDPILDFDKCLSEQHFRCVADQSAYLRSAWVLSGIRSLADHPMGIGYTKSYMAHLWGVAGQKGMYQYNDIFLVELAVCFGFLGLLFYLWLFADVTLNLKNLIKKKSNYELLLLGALLFTLFGRGMVDQLTDGLWRYLMAILGMFYGLLYRQKFSSNKGTIDV
jgi:hypothetical protein